MVSSLLTLSASLAVVLLLSGCAQPGGAQPGKPQPEPTPTESSQPASPTSTGAPQPTPSPTPSDQTPGPTASPTGAEQVTPSPVVPAQSATPSATGQPSGQGVSMPPGAEPLVESARQDAARRAGVSPQQVTLVSVRQVEWSDSSLGCPQPGMMYSQVVTPGYLIVLSAGGKTYEYHADRGRHVVYCEHPRPPLSAD